MISSAGTEVIRDSKPHCLVGLVHTQKCSQSQSGAHVSATQLMLTSLSQNLPYP